MTHVVYLVAGYGLTALVLGAYVVRLLTRERALARVVAARRPLSAGPPAGRPVPTGPGTAEGDGRRWS